MLIHFVLIAIGAFLLGSIPFGVLVARAKGIDLRAHGSGNIGATNAIRVLGTGPGLAVFALDVLKGVLPTLAGRALLPPEIWGLDQQPLLMLLGTFAILGHSFSPWLGFKGGKGISTILGVGLGAIPLCALLAFLTMIVVTAISRYVSLGSMVGVGSSLVWNRVLGDSWQMLPVLGLLTAFIVYRHRGNIARLAAGTESKFKFGKTAGPPEVEADDEPDPTPKTSENDDVETPSGSAARVAKPAL